MAKPELTSTVTFLYFQDLEGAKGFFSEVLELEAVYDPGWACVYRLKDKAFLGAVDAGSGSIDVEARGGVLVSLTANNLEEMHRSLGERGVADLSKIRQVKDMALKSFFFTGPEGYKFEVQQFTSGELRALF